MLNGDLCILMEIKDFFLGVLFIALILLDNFFLRYFLQPQMYRKVRSLKQISRIHIVIAFV